MPLALLLTLLAAGPQGPAESPADPDATEEVAEAAQPPKEKGVEGIVIPLVSYNTDLGFGYGGVGGMYIYAPGYVPYRFAIAAQAFWTTRGIQNHFLRFDGPRLLGSARVEARLEYRRELRAPYYGLGNVSSQGYRGPQSAEAVNWDRLAPGAWARVRFNPLGEKHPFETWAGYYFRWTRVGTFPGSVLAQEAPVGIEGGATGQLLAGMLWDSRDEETNPTRGGVEEVALRLSTRATVSRYEYVGLTLVERRYFPLAHRLVLAQRLTLDWLAGDVPFFELANVGGSMQGEGIGGMSSVRGVPRNRYVGDVKLFSNTELRYDPLDFRLFRWKFTLGGLAFFDVGRVWHPRVEDGTWATWHPGMGVGLRLTRRAAVARVDYGVATETWRQAIYVTFGHMF